MIGARAGYAASVRAILPSDGGPGGARASGITSYAQGRGAQRLKSVARCAALPAHRHRNLTLLHAFFKSACATVSRRGEALSASVLAHACDMAVRCTRAGPKCRHLHAGHGPHCAARGQQTHLRVFLCHRAWNFQEPRENERWIIRGCQPMPMDGWMPTVRHAHGARHAGSPPSAAPQALCSL